MSAKIQKNERDVCVNIKFEAIETVWITIIILFLVDKKSISKQNKWSKAQILG
ncbi:MAG: hypothetical protein ACRYFB_09460 [Janthinobacterium lividum]